MLASEKVQINPSIQFSDLDEAVKYTLLDFIYKLDTSVCNLSIHSTQDNSIDQFRIPGDHAQGLSLLAVPVRNFCQSIAFGNIQRRNNVKMALKHFVETVQSGVVSFKNLIGIVKVLY